MTVFTPSMGGGRSIRELCAVAKPARYAGGEVNSLPKPGVRPVIALAFPDVYEIGMSYLGLARLYEIVNAAPRFAAERVFAPAPDRAAQLRRRGERLGGLETGRPLRDFDIIGFSLTYELSLPDMLCMLDLGGVPPLRAARDRDRDCIASPDPGAGAANAASPGAMPLVIAGGPLALNPAPLAAICDGVFLGEGDEAILEIMAAAAATLSSRASRAERLAALAAVPGTHVFGVSRERARRRVFYGFGSPVEAPLGVAAAVPCGLSADLPFGSPGVVTTARRPIAPNIQVVHDRVTVEISRGCTHGCRFCQAGCITRPLRHRSEASIIAEAETALQATGYDEVSLLALSACDHPRIRSIAAALVERFGGRGISLSIPSTRVDAFSTLTNRLVNKCGRRTGITLAPEVATRRLDLVVNKGAAPPGGEAAPAGPTPEPLAAAVAEAFADRRRSVKLYYLIGLPGETMDDVLAIAGQLAGLAELARRHQGEIHAAVSIFCPKPWTPFQWAGMERPATLMEKIRRLREAAPRRRVKLDINSLAPSLVEAALARGGESVGRALEKMLHGGHGLQAWTEHFNAAAWEEAFAAAGLSLEDEACRQFNESEALPWETIDCGVSREFLLREWRKAQAAARGETENVVTPDCAGGLCAACGLPCQGTQPAGESPATMRAAASGPIAAAAEASIPATASAMPDSANASPAPGMPAAPAAPPTPVAAATTAGASVMPVRRPHLLTNRLVNNAETSSNRTDEQDLPMAPLASAAADSQPAANVSPARCLGFRFARLGPAVMLGHLDLMNVMLRAFRRAGIRTALTRGFSPRPRLRLALSLPLGVAAEDEYAEADVFDVTPDEFLARLNATLPEGVCFTSADWRAGKSVPQVDRLHYRIETSAAGPLMARMRELAAAEIVSVRKGRERRRRVGDFLENLESGADSVSFTLRHDPAGSLSVSDLTAKLLELDPELTVTRTRMMLARDGP